MNENRRKMTPEEYLEEFKLNLSTLENDKPEYLFKEWPIDIKFFKDDEDNKPIFTQMAELFLYNYSSTPKEYLGKIKPIDRNNTYKISSHDGKHVSIKDDYTVEKVEAKAIFNTIKGNKYPFEIIDYEIPLRDTSLDKGIGEIDLVGKKDNVVYLLELKKFQAPNGALFHMILQSYTYMKLLNLDKFKEEYQCDSIIPAILVFENSDNYKQFYDPKNTVFKELLAHLGMKAFFIKNSSVSYKKEDDIYEFDGDYPKLKGCVEIEEMK